MKIINLPLSTSAPRQVEKNYQDLPKYYDFGHHEEKEETLRHNMRVINQVVAVMVDMFC